MNGSRGDRVLAFPAQPLRWEVIVVRGERAAFVELHASGAGFGASYVGDRRTGRLRPTSRSFEVTRAGAST